MNSGDQTNEYRIRQKLKEFLLQEAEKMVLKKLMRNRHSSLDHINFKYNHNHYTFDEKNNHFEYEIENCMRYMN